MIELCAQAMGYECRYIDGKLMCDEWRYVDGRVRTFEGGEFEYDPLQNTMQALALSERFDQECRGVLLGVLTGETRNLRRAIVECIAEMQSEKRK